MKNNSRGVSLHIIIIGAILLAIAPILFTWGWQERQDTLDATRGEIDTYYVLNQSKPVHVELGGLGRDYNISELENGIDLTRLFNLQEGNQTFNSFPISIELVDNKLSINAEIKNSDNTTIAKIINNNWATVHPDSLLIWDRNYNAYAFEVIDSEKLPVLQIILTGQNKILIGCNLLHQGMPAFFTLTRGFSFYSDGNIPSSAIENMRSSTIFKYPSEEYLGIFVNNLDSLLSFPFESPYPSNIVNVTSPLYESNLIIASSALTAILGTIFVSFFAVKKYKSSSPIKDKKKLSKSTKKTKNSKRKN